MIWRCCKAINFSTKTLLQPSDVRILCPFDFSHAIAPSENYSAVEKSQPYTFRGKSSIRKSFA